MRTACIYMHMYSETVLSNPINALINLYFIPIIRIYEKDLVGFFPNKKSCTRRIASLPPFLRTNILDNGHYFYVHMQIKRYLMTAPTSPILIL